MKQCDICCGCSDEIQISQGHDATRLELVFQAKTIQRGNSAPEKNCGVSNGET
jgi:hypothetical protein